MCGRWNFYLCSIEGNVASIFLNLALASVAPMESLRHVVIVRLKMLEPNPQGLTGSGEAETLGAIEEVLTEQLAPHVHLPDPDSADVDESAPEAIPEAILVGRVTCGGFRDIYFYAGDPSDWAERVSEIMIRYPAYQAEVMATNDPGWEAYLSFLFPSPRDLQGIFNRELCEQLEDHGDPLTAPREIDHWIRVSTEEAQARVIDAATKLGFEVRGVSLDEGDEDADEAPDGDDGEDPGPQIRIQLMRRDVPSYEAIDEITMPLFELAEEHGGEYDGWETSVEAV